MPNSTGRQMFKSPAESFAHRTERQDGCLIWTGAVKDTGYGAMWDGKRVIRPHRWAWEQIHGPIAPGADIDHICGNRLCCEASHLRPTTRKQNMENLQGPNANSTTGVRGVHWKARDGVYHVRVKHNYREYSGGRFKDLAQAEAAAIELRNKLFTHNVRDREISA